MSWGVWEDSRTPYPLGTVPFIANGKAVVGSNLKKKGNVVLQPQPTDSPRDPLNWSYKRKLIIVLVLLMSFSAVAGISSMLSHVVARIAVQNHVDPQTLSADALRTPGMTITVISLFLSSATVAVWGKRVLLIIASVVVLVTTLLGVFANSVIHYAVISALLNLSSTSIGLMRAPIIADISYVHERGTIIALCGVVNSIGGDVSIYISSTLITKLGPKHTFIISFAAWIPIALLIYFFFLETTFDRKAYRAKHSIKRTEVPNISNEGLNVSNEVLNVSNEVLNVSNEVPNVSNKVVPMLVNDSGEVVSSGTGTGLSEDWINERKPTMREDLKIFRGRLTRRSFLKALVQPFPILVFPSVAFSTIVHGALIFLSQDQLYLIGFPGSFAAIGATIVAGLLNDWLIKYISRQNEGIFEPEFRLLGMFPAFILSTLGFLLLGAAFGQRAPVPFVVGSGLLINAATPFADSASFTYIFDTQRKSATEAFVVVTFVETMARVFATRYVPAWVDRVGPVTVLSIVLALNTAFIALTIPMYAYGKRMRAAIHRNKKLMKFVVFG